MVALMFPVIPNPTRAIVAPAVSTARLMPPDLLCDYETGDLVVDASGDIVLADGVRAWQQCWINRLLVQQAAYHVYPRSLGINHTRLMRLPTRGRIEAEYTGRIQRQAARDRATREARRIRFAWANDTCYLSVVLVAITGDNIPVGVSLHA